MCNKGQNLYIFAKYLWEGIAFFNFVISVTVTEITESCFVYRIETYCFCFVDKTKTRYYYFVYKTIVRNRIKYMQFQHFSLTLQKQPC